LTRHFGTNPTLAGSRLLDRLNARKEAFMFRLVATAFLGYVALRIMREITDTVPEDFGSHLPQQHRRAKPRAAATATKKQAARRKPAKPAPKAAAETA